MAKCLEMRLRGLPLLRNGSAENYRLFVSVAGRNEERENAVTAYGEFMVYFWRYFSQELEKSQKKSY